MNTLTNEQTLKEPVKMESKGLIDEIIERSTKTHIPDVDDYWCGIYLKTLESLRYLDDGDLYYYYSRGVNDTLDKVQELLQSDKSDDEVLEQLMQLCGI